MWNFRNKAVIFLFIIGFCALCNAQVTSDVDAIDSDKKNSSDSLPSSSPSILAEDNISDVDKKKHKTTTTTTTEKTPLALEVAEISAFDSKNEGNEEEKHKTTTTSTSTTPTTTTTTTTSTTTTQKPTTTSSSTTTSTTTTTTIPPTTTKSTTTTTTATPKPTPTPKPNPHPKPDIGLWNSSCILLQMAAEVNFTYPTKDNKTAQAHMIVPSSAKVHDYDCTEKGETQNLVLEWSSENYPNSLTVQFEKNNSEYGLFMLMFRLQSSEFPNAKENTTIQLIHQKNTFLTPLKMSYHCTREQKLNLTSTLNSKDSIGVVSLTNLQFEAFDSKNGTTKFSTAKDCDAIDTPDIVPIAVGIALIALILIVLISYLVARRRSTARGYMSF